LEVGSSSQGTVFHLGSFRNVLWPEMIDFAVFKESAECHKENQGKVYQHDAMFEKDTLSD
jgi:hypothetical protein